MKRSPIVTNFTVEPSLKHAGIWFTRAERSRREGLQFRPGPKGAILHVIDRKRESITVVASRGDGQKPIHRVSIAANYERQVYVETLKCVAKILGIGNWRDVEHALPVRNWTELSAFAVTGRRS